MIVLGSAGAVLADPSKKRASGGMPKPGPTEDWLRRERPAAMDRADHMYGMVRKIRNMHGVRRDDDDTNKRHQRAWILLDSGGPLEHSVPGHGRCWTSWPCFASKWPPEDFRVRVVLLRLVLTDLPRAGRRAREFAEAEAFGDEVAGRVADGAD